MPTPRRTIALGPPYDDGKVPRAPVEESVEDRLTRLEKMLERIEDTVVVIRDLRRERAVGTEESR